ncbi:MAG: isocitrate lyase/phosphoenolpyruvate mutase family protein [Gammaproteobacteria bacterium]|nr:isocitrate lyase/phosphoenolpyruvate mutase family protein [Gammaproteobacteria bacterium]MDE2250843.1 isocitrate lyase/phosphoenolpyruvate mutase family protein [Gammaproteobacteria bacterium]
MHDTTVYAQRRRNFRALHQQGCFLLPNPWDIGGAVRLERLGYQAIASSSAACALALGRTDYHITLAQALDHLRLLVNATQLPVNADFEDGFADEPERVADNVRAAIATGIAGISIEDRNGGQLHERARAIERVAAARAAIADAGADVVLVARTEAYLQGHTDPGPVIERLQAFAAAGADCLYAPGVEDMGAIRDIVRAVAPKPVNVLLHGRQMQVGELAGAGVRRVSLGGALAGAAWRAFEAAARQFLEHGTLQSRG